MSWFFVLSNHSGHLMLVTVFEPRRLAVQNSSHGYLPRNHAVRLCHNHHPRFLLATLRVDRFSLTAETD